MSREVVITNVQIVTAHEVLHGTLQVVDGNIAGISSGATALASALDWDGDYLLPGLVEVHTDNLEKHLMPRPGVRWPVMAALLAHDAQVAAAGITTVFDGLCIGEFDADSVRTREGAAQAGAALHRAQEAGLLRADHVLHIRCEIAGPGILDLFQPFVGDPMVRLVSIMDHTPGQRQWTDMDKFRTYSQGQKSWTAEKTDQVVRDRQEMQRLHAEGNRRDIVELCRKLGLPLASHDDTTPEHVAQASAAGMTISEFPTSRAAAQAAREHGMFIVMGAPNVVRGGSHSGNVSALELARARLLDGLSSDYVPISLLQAAFMLREQADFTLPEAVATVSANPARMAALGDRGEIRVGQRADLIRVRETEHTPAVMSAWVMGARVA